MGNSNSSLVPSELCNIKLNDYFNGLISTKLADIQSVSEQGRINVFSGTCSVDSGENPIFISSTELLNDSNDVKFPFNSIFYRVKLKDIYNAVCKYDPETDCEVDCNELSFLGMFLNLTVPALRFQIDFGSRLLNEVPNLYLLKANFEYCNRIDNSNECHEEDCDDCDCNGCSTNWKQAFYDGCSTNSTGNSCRCPESDITLSTNNIKYACKGLNNNLTENNCGQDTCGACSKCYKQVSLLNILNKCESLTKVSKYMDKLKLCNPPKISCPTQHFYNFKIPLRIGDLLIIYENCKSSKFEILLGRCAFSDYLGIRNNLCNPVYPPCPPLVGDFPAPTCEPCDPTGNTMISCSVQPPPEPPVLPCEQPPTPPPQPTPPV